NDRRVLSLAGLPVAMPEQPGFRIDLKQPGLGGRNVEPPGNESLGDGHSMSVFQEHVRFERRDDEFHVETLFHKIRGDKPKPLRLRKPGLYELGKQSAPHPLSSARCPVSEARRCQTTPSKQA